MTTFWISFSCFFVSVWGHSSDLASTSVPRSSLSLSTTSPTSSSTRSAFPSSVPSPKPNSSSRQGTRNPKRGIAFASSGNTDDIINANQTHSAISWIYDWADLPPAYIAQSNLKYIPMQWGSGSIDKLADAVSAQGADTILGFNEPDFVDEANIQVQNAMALWKEFIQPLKQHDIKLGGPAVTATSTGKQWLTEFLSACNQCSIDFLPLHWYGSGTEGFYNYIWDMHSSFPQFPIWITEYADVSDNKTEVWDFMNQTINYLDSLDWIERYAWFGFFRPEDNVNYNMLGEDGSLNDLGQLYIGADTIHTSSRNTQASPQYQTISPSDQPGQPLVTSWPQVNSASVWNQRSLSISLLLNTIASFCVMLFGA